MSICSSGLSRMSGMSTFVGCFRFSIKLYSAGRLLYCVGEMPKITKNASILKEIEQGPSVPALHSNADIEKIEKLLELPAADFSSKISQTITLLSKLSSISSELLVNVFKKSLQSATIGTVAQVCSILACLVCHNYDEDEVITELKRCKDIDAVFVLALLWKYYHEDDKEGKSGKLDQIVKIITLMAVSYPLDLLIHGSPYLKVWKEQLLSEIEVQRKRIQLVSQSGESKVNLRSDPNKFVYIHIPL